MKAIFSDLTVVVVYKQDSEQRHENYKKFVDYWSDLTNVLVQEDDEGDFNRARLFNKAVDKVKTKYVAIADIDTIIDSKQISTALDLLDNGGADFVFPYSTVYEVDLNLKPLAKWKTYVVDKKFFKEQLGVDYDPSVVIKEPHYLGHMYICSKVLYKEFGGENELYNGSGFAGDHERYYRAIKKGYTFKRVLGPTKHMTHPRFTSTRGDWQLNFERFVRDYNEYFTN